jgi:hypothetical protein
MSNIKQLKDQIRQANELLQFKAYQNDGMKKYINDLNEKLKELQMSTFKSESGEFKGSKTFSILTADDKRVITFGVTKAKAILATLEELKKFVEENEKKTENV